MKYKFLDSSMYNIGSAIAVILLSQPIQTHAPNDALSTNQPHYNLSNRPTLNSRLENMGEFKIPYSLQIQKQPPNEAYLEKLLRETALFAFRETTMGLEGIKSSFGGNTLERHYTKIVASAGIRG